MERWTLATAVACAIGLAGCGGRDDAPDSTSGGADFEAIAAEYFEQRFAFHPSLASEAGLHDYDGRLGRRDQAAVEAYLATLTDLETRLEAIDVGQLNANEQLDRELVLRAIRGELFFLGEVATWRKDPRFYANELDMTLLLQLDYAPLAVRMEAIVSRLEQVPELIAAAAANVINPPRPFVETALVTYGGWPGFLEVNLTEALASVDDPDLQSRFRTARDSAAAAIRSYADYLETEVLPSASGDFALGPELYRKMNTVLAGVDVPTDRLEEIAAAELRRLQALADSLADVIAPGQGVEAAFDSVALDSPPADSIVSAAASVIDELRDFVVAADLGTVLPGSVDVREIPPYRRTNFAYIIIPGPLDTLRTGFYFIHPVEPDWSEAAKQAFLATNNEYAILNVSAHEAYPGHYHHWNHLNRSPTLAQQLLTAYVTTEGWAHYTEEMTWREGLADGSPKLGLAVVQDALLRVVRFLSSVGLHSEGMTVEQSEELFRTLAYQDSVNARQQALRGTYDPQYLNYTLGKLMILQLRDEVMQARGTEFDLGEFHDEFMSNGAPPVPWIARRILDEPDWQPFRGAGAGSPGGS